VFLRDNNADFMVAGGAEACLHRPLTVAGFNRMRAVEKFRPADSLVSLR
jgi:3-oxoacyl-(acyl-carrier-protein) synthase